MTLDSDNLLAISVIKLKIIAKETMVCDWLLARRDAGASLDFRGRYASAAWELDQGYNGFVLVPMCIRVQREEGTLTAKWEINSQVTGVTSVVS